MNGNKPSHAFTIRFNGLARDLITDVKVCEAYDPAVPPDPLPNPEPAKGLWDTGATHTSISVGLAAKLGLISTGKIKVDHADGESICETYVINLTLTNGILIPGLTVNASKLPMKCDMLIGMDVISEGDFALSQESGKTLFSFRIPSSHTVDFVKEINSTVLRSVKPNQIPCICGKQKKFKMCCQHKYL